MRIVVHSLFCQNTTSYLDNSDFYFLMKLRIETYSTPLWSEDTNLLFIPLLSIGHPSCLVLSFGDKTFLKRVYSVCLLVWAVCSFVTSTLAVKDTIVLYCIEFKEGSIYTQQEVCIFFTEYGHVGY